MVPSHSSIEEAQCREAGIVLKQAVPAVAAFLPVTDASASQKVLLYGAHVPGLR